MAMSEETTCARGHVLYLKYLLLLGKATPIALKVVIKDIEQKQNKPLASIVEEKKDDLRNNNNETYLALFEEHEVNAQIDSWDISVFCDVLFVLLGDPELEIIRCIRDHRKDIERYTDSASLGYKPFKEKWDSLLQAINELIDHRIGEDKYDCKCLIHSYDESNIKESELYVSKGLIEKMKQTNVLKEHIDIAKTSESCLMPNKDTCTGSNIGGSANEIKVTVERTVLTIEFSKRLEDTSVNTNEPAIFVCELDTVANTVEWQKNRTRLTETERLKYVTKENTNILLISNAKKEDEGEYSCNFGNISTSAFLKVYEQDLKIVEHLHVIEKNIKEGMGITLTCKTNTDARKPKWFHNRKDITLSCRILEFSQGLEHKLIIKTVKVDDGGEYTVAFDRVSSHTSIVVKDNFYPGLKYQLTKEDYRNWVKGVLGLS